MIISLWTEWRKDWREKYARIDSPRNDVVFGLSISEPSIMNGQSVMWCVIAEHTRACQRIWFNRLLVMMTDDWWFIIANRYAIIFILINEIYYCAQHMFSLFANIYACRVRFANIQHIYWMACRMRRGISWTAICHFWIMYGWSKDFRIECAKAYAYAEDAIQHGDWNLENHSIHSQILIEQ